MTIQLGFRIERGTGAYPAKIREDGRVGACVGDEALLWDALQEARALMEEVLADLGQALVGNQAVVADLDQALVDNRAVVAERDALRRENAELKAQLEQRKGKR